MSDSTESPCRAVRMETTKAKAWPDRQDALCLLSIFDRVESQRNWKDLSRAGVFDTLSLRPDPESGVTEFEAAALARVQLHLDGVGHSYVWTRRDLPPRLIGKGNWQPQFELLPNYTISRYDLEKLAKEKP